MYDVTVAAEYHYPWRGEAATLEEARVKAIAEAESMVPIGRTHGRPQWAYSGFELQTREESPCS